MEKICSTCKLSKTIDAFSKNKTKKDGLNYECKDCRVIYIKQHYTENKQYYKDKTNNRCKKLRAWLFELKTTLKCSKCEENHIACIEFHHRDQTQKDFEISKAVAKGFTKERILEEIAKCDVICSNCHRKLHWETKTGPYVCRR